jgi:putative ribosome biogenesis GTPase RsgA
MSKDAKSSKSRNVKTRKDQGAERIKTSILISRSVHIRIGALAGIRGVDKSTLINSLLEEATRGVVVSLRGPLAEGFGAGEGAFEESGTNDAA